MNNNLCQFQTFVRSRHHSCEYLKKQLRVSNEIYKKYNHTGLEPMGGMVTPPVPIIDQCRVHMPLPYMYWEPIGAMVTPLIPSKLLIGYNRHYTQLWLITSFTDLRIRNWNCVWNNSEYPRMSFNAFCLRLG